MLVCLVNDIADLKRIEDGSFTCKNSKFNPRKALDFVISIFTLQCELQKAKLQIVGDDNCVPKKLVGDKARLEQVIFTLIKYCLRLSKGSNIFVRPAYDPVSFSFTVRIG